MFPLPVLQHHLGASGVRTQPHPATARAPRAAFLKDSPKPSRRLPGHFKPGWSMGGQAIPTASTPGYRNKRNSNPGLKSKQDAVARSGRVCQQGLLLGGAPAGFIHLRVNKHSVLHTGAFVLRQPLHNPSAVTDMGWASSTDMTNL